MYNVPNQRKLSKENRSDWMNQRLFQCSVEFSGVREIFFFSQNLTENQMPLQWQLDTAHDQYNFLHADFKITSLQTAFEWLLVRLYPWYLFRVFCRLLWSILLFFFFTPLPNRSGLCLLFLCTVYYTPLREIYHLPYFLSCRDTPLLPVQNVE